MSILTKAELAALLSDGPHLSVFDSLSHLEQVSSYNNTTYDSALYTLTAGTLLTIRVNRNEIVTQTAGAWILQVETNSVEQFKVHHIQLNTAGTIGTSVKSATLTPYQAGNNFFLIDSSGVDLTKTTYVGLEPLGAGGAVTYQSTTGQSVFSMNAGTGAITDQSTFRWGYRVGLKPTVDFIKQTTPSSFSLADEIANKTTITIPEGIFTVSSPLAINRQGMTIRGVNPQLSKIQISGSITAFNVTAKDVVFENFSILGTRANKSAGDTSDFANDAQIQALTNKTAQRGIYADANANTMRVRGMNLYNCGGAALEYEGSTGNNDRDGHVITNNRFSQNYAGILARGEYGLINDNMFGRNGIGVAVYGGNNCLANNNASGNVIGLVIGDGSNNSHGTWSGGNLNHCDLYGVYGYNFDEGWNMTNVCCWDSYVKLVNATGFIWEGGQINRENFLVSGCTNVIIDSQRLHSVSP